MRLLGLQVDLVGVHTMEEDVLLVLDREPHGDGDRRLVSLVDSINTFDLFCDLVAQPCFVEVRLLAAVEVLLGSHHGLGVSQLLLERCRLIGHGASLPELIDPLRLHQLFTLHQGTLNLILHILNILQKL